MLPLDNAYSALPHRFFARVRRKPNPAHIPRNHRIQATIDAALGGDLGPTADPDGGARRSVL